MKYSEYQHSMYDLGVPSPELYKVVQAQRALLKIEERLKHRVRTMTYKGFNWYYFNDQACINEFDPQQWIEYIPETKK